MVVKVQPAAHTVQVDNQKSLESVSSQPGGRGGSKESKFKSEKHLNTTCTEDPTIVQRYSM